MTAADLTYDPLSHTSKAPDGRDVPHVTAILKAVGVAVDFDGLRQDLGRTIADRIDFKRDVGTATHMDCHAWDDGDLVLDTVDERVKPYLEAWAIFRQHLKLSPLVRERRILHSGLHYTGILDGIFHQSGTGKVVLVDIKTGKTSYADRLQVAAYEMAWVDQHPDGPIRIDERWIAYLRPALAVPYRVLNCSAEPGAWRDGQKFAACVTVFGLQQEGRRS